MERGEGCFLYDVDGNKYLDMQNNYTSLIHGHSHPGVSEIAKQQLEKGVVLGSLLAVHWRTEKPKTARDTFEGLLNTWDLGGCFIWKMINNGLFSAPRGMYVVSTPMTEIEIDGAIRAFEKTLAILKPYIEDKLPHLKEN